MWGIDQYSIEKLQTGVALQKVVQILRRGPAGEGVKLPGSRLEVIQCNGEAFFIQAVLVDSPHRSDTLVAGTGDDLDIIEYERIGVAKVPQHLQLLHVFYRESHQSIQVCVEQPGFFGLRLQPQGSPVLHQSLCRKIPFLEQVSPLQMVGRVASADGIVDRILVQGDVLQSDTGDFVVRTPPQGLGKSANSLFGITAAIIGQAQRVPYQGAFTVGLQDLSKNVDRLVRLIPQ
ncbi:hypothetical protein ES708_02693 [subsurface metagenome]